MIVWLRHFLGWLRGAFSAREDLILENLALRQQVLALHAQRPRRRLTASHKLFWVVLRKLWARWKRPLILVTPRTVVGWHRAGFRLYWKWLSRPRSAGGRKRISEEIRTLIFRMVAENPTWGAPGIHGELLKLDFDVSEPTVSRWVQRAPRPPGPARHWLTFLRNHREAIAAMDLFTVPTLTFGILYCFFIIGHARRRILHHNVTRNPNALWVALQVHETWDYGQQPQRFLIFDRDSKFSSEVLSTVKAIGCRPVRRKTVALAVEQQQRVIARRLKVPVIGAVLLLPVHRDLCAVHVQHHALRRINRFRPCTLAQIVGTTTVSYTHLRAHETVLDLVCR